MILEIISISLFRNKKRIFKNFNFKLKKSQIAALIGKNGSGKTSLLDMVVGLIKPDSGVIRIDKCNIDEIGENKKFKFGVQSEHQFIPSAICFQNFLNNNIGKLSQGSNALTSILGILTNTLS